MKLAYDKLFLSTPSARRATANLAYMMFGLEISIHALREEGDTVLYRAGYAQLRFLSTPSARRATKAMMICKSNVL